MRLHRPTLALAVVLALFGLLSGCGEPIADKRAIPAQLGADAREQHRKLSMDGAHNFRDLGGYRTNDGKQVKWGMLYRSDQLSKLSGEDERFMDRLGLVRIIDFRSPEERENEPTRIAPDSSIRIEQRPITVEGAAVKELGERIFSGDVQPGELDNFLVDANRDFVEMHTPVYREWMQSLLQPEGYPALFHCTAGKDRTGFAAAMVLAALDVPRETINQDYLATNAYTEDYREKVKLFITLRSFGKVDGDTLEPLFGVQQRYLDEAFKAIDEHYGSLDNYLETGLGLTPDKRARLRELLLEG